MKIAVVGTGYVGLVTGTCFADSGNEVTCVDIDQEKIEMLNQGKVPIFEPGLSELVSRNTESGRLQFSTDLSDAVDSARLIYLAVGTPPRADGSANLSALWAVLEQIAPHLSEDAIVIIKSTVPVGTNRKAFIRLKEHTGRECNVASNPEFLKEGAAIEDFTKPDRVVVGVRNEETANVLKKLFAPFLRTDNPFLVMSPESAELTKYIANSLLATKISFINEMANVCQLLGGDINDVRRGIGHDARIGFAFLFPGVGYGGSCFPKDIRALESTAQDAGYNSLILKAVDEINQRQKKVMLEMIDRHYNSDISGKTFAVWGLAFKPKTDDIREAPALVLIDWLLEKGATAKVHDPEAMSNVRSLYGEKISYTDQPMEALNDAHALAIMTEWSEFRHPDFAEMRKRMSESVVFDGRNLYEPNLIKEAGFHYYSIGRQNVKPS